MEKKNHTPVLATEVLNILDPKPGQDFVDGTVGLGGHARLILERTVPNGRLLAIDRDASNLEEAKKNLQIFGERVVYIHDSYSNLKQQAYDHGFTQIHGILLDIGFSSVHVDDPTRGFSFQNEGPLDMRYNIDDELTAEMIVNSWKAEELADIFFRYGEERHAHKIAKEIVSQRRQKRIRTTKELADLIATILPRRPYGHGIHPATRVFQALRIAVNDELNELEQTLPQTLDALIPGSKLAVISFHSLEDRIVKQFMRSHSKKELSVLTKRPLTASEEETKINPRSRSAKLRAAKRL